jgi:hypothetical protein
MSHSLKLLIRRWFPGKGCLYLRSAEMTDEEARSLLDASLPMIEDSRLLENEKTLREIKLCDHEQARAFVLVDREPDPDHPQRGTRPFRLLYLPDPDRFLREAVEKRLAAVELPEAANEMLDAGWHLASHGKIKVLSGNNRRLWCKTLVPIVKRHRKLASVVVVVAVLIAGVGLILSYPRSQAVIPSQGFRLKPQDGFDSEDRGWDKAKEDMQGLLQTCMDEARQTKHDTSEMSDSEILNNFGRLFQVSFLDGLDERSRNHYKKIKKNDPTTHPFVAFFTRFPEDSDSLPQDSEPRGSKWSHRARKYLDKLNSWLEQDGSTIKLDVERPEAIVQQARLELSYKEFYRRWKKENLQQDLEHGGELCLLDKQPNMEWVAKVRKIIENRCPP